MITSKIKGGILGALIEYIMLTAPIALYVLFEAIHKDDAYYFITSPEWGIAVIFLIYVGLTEYSNAARSSKKADEVVIKLISLVRFIAIIVSVIVSFSSVMWDNKCLMIFRVVLFALVSIAFFLFHSAAHLIPNNVRQT